MSDDPRYHPEVVRRMRVLPVAGEALPIDANCFGCAGSEAQGARIELALRVAAGRVAAASFRAYGCPHVIASCSWLAERLVGCRREELAAWDWREVQQALAVPPQKFGRLLTIQDAVHDAARNWPLPAAV
jgi:NifU-like protein involved in Fe-S cluster formation